MTSLFGRHVKGSPVTESKLVEGNTGLMDATPSQFSRDISTNIVSTEEVFYDTSRDTAQSTTISHTADVNSTVVSEHTDITSRLTDATTLIPNAETPVFTNDETSVFSNAETSALTSDEAPVLSSAETAMFTNAVDNHYNYTLTLTRPAAQTRSFVIIDSILQLPSSDEAQSRDADVSTTDAFVLLPYVLLVSLLMIGLVVSFLRFHFKYRERYQKRRRVAASESQQKHEQASRALNLEAGTSHGSTHAQSKWKKITWPKTKYMRVRRSEGRSSRLSCETYRGTNMFMMMFMPRASHGAMTTRM